MRSGRRSLIVCQSHHIALLCFQGARRRFGRPHYFITGFGFCKPPRRFFVNFFRSPRGDSDIPSGDILKLSRLSVFASGVGDFFAARPAGRPGCLRFRHVRPLPFPALADNEPAVTSLRKRSVRPTRRGSEKKATGAPRESEPAGVRRGAVGAEAKIARPAALRRLDASGCRISF